MHKPRLFLFIFLTLALVLGLSAASAQTAENPLPIAYGQTVQGQFASSSDYFFYIFTGTVGDIVQISATSPNGVDTYLQLGDGLANLLVENDDTNGLDPFVEYTLGYTGQYLIGIGGYSAGSYSLTLSSNTVPAQGGQTTSIPSTPISYGQTVEGQTIDLQNVTFYSFSGRAGEQVSIVMESPNADTYLQFGDANANLLAENDDAEGMGTNSRIDFTLPSDGTYLIGAAGYAAGNYRLTLTVGSQGGQPPQQPDQPPAQQTGSPTVTPIEYGQTVSGQTISLDNPVIYTFAGTAGDNVSIAASSDTVDTYLLFTDGNGELLAENDDISSDNLNSLVNFTLPANGNYLIGVLGYSAGPFTLTLSSGSGGTPDQTFVSQPTGDVYTGEINDAQPFVEFPIENVPDGARITIDMTTTSGDLDGYLGLVYGENVVAENDDRAQGDTNPLLEYPQAQAGNYTVVATRYSFEEGKTSGSFQIAIDVSGGGGTVVALPPDNQTTTAPDPTANGYPANNPQPVADWTVLAYYGADNNLEDGLMVDMNEFEIAGGSDQTVRVVMLLDRANEYDTTNGDWTDTRLFEVGADVSNDANGFTTPTLDSVVLADLGELDTSYGGNLTDFLVWGITNYPANNYIVSINDHGGAWFGTVSDDSASDGGLLSIPELVESFRTALEVTGVPKFAMLINDACLMSSVEHYAAIAPYFDYVIGSPEVTLNPGFDMTLLTETLRENPNIPVPELGSMLVDKFVDDMTAGSPDLVDVLGANMTDLRSFDSVVQSVENFASVVNTNPAAYSTLLGQIRSNTYTYSFFLPEDQFGPATNIDLGDFMAQVAEQSPNPELATAAQSVLTAIDGVLVHKNAGNHLSKWGSMYNIFFPSNSTYFAPSYFDEVPLQNWANMLRNYFGDVTATRGIRAVGAPATSVPSMLPSAAEDRVPTVTVTNVYPQVTSVLTPTSVAVEVVARNVSFGNFTVDQIQPDGSKIRLDASRIVTQVIEDGVVNWVNKWHPGVDETNFTWDVTLPRVTDGTNTNFELVGTQDDITSMAGRYRFPGSQQWQDVTVIFGDDKFAETMIARDATGSSALASITPVAGGEFQAYRSTVSPDGRVILQPGNVYTWTDTGISYEYAPAPTGQYELGFIVESFSGATGFDSVAVTVNNDKVDPARIGYVDTDWGLEVLVPAGWFNFTYFPDSDWLQANTTDNTQYIFIYPAYNATDAQTAFDEVVEKYTVFVQGEPRPITILGIPAIEFDLDYVLGEGDEQQHFIGRAFALFKQDLGFGFVFSAESVDGIDLDRNYALLINGLHFFDVPNFEAQDTGMWSNRFYSDLVRLPIPMTWIEQQIGDWYGYATDETFTTAAAVMELPGTDATAIVNDLVNQYVGGQPNFERLAEETYYGENHTWATVAYRYEGMMGRMHVTIKEETGMAYALWVEAPADQAPELMRSIFDRILDGLIIYDE